MNNNGDYIAYLNSLHNYNAQNGNAYGEKNVGSDFFQEVAVRIGLSSYIEKQLKGEEPYVLVLTGHAGDGKTSIMYQVLKDFGIPFNADEKVSDIILPDGRKCRCIKDFSELNDDEKLTVLKECIGLPRLGKFVFMVSNTGPLINTFGKLFEEEEKEDAKIELIDAMDQNSGEVTDIKGVKIGIINVAAVDNTYFAVEFLHKLIKKSLWDSCVNCSKSAYCHIYRNRNLIDKNSQRVFEFIKDHYVWLVEHGRRLTVRSMTEQLSYMITGGIECEYVIPMDANKMLFFNLFFGYVGLKRNDRANSIIAVREARMCAYDRKRLRADEKFLIDRNYGMIFGNEIKDILDESYKKDGYISGWAEFLRRAYIFANIVTDENQKTEDDEDIFSKQFGRYMQLRSGAVKPSRADTNIIIDALSMVYLGKVEEGASGNISITLSKNSGVTQNVQLVTGLIPTRKMSLAQVETKDSDFNSENKRYELRVRVEKHTLDSVISLPMLDYFDELRNGVISTNIDPQLSHGVESLKAQLVRQYGDDDDGMIEIIVLKNKTNSRYRLEIGDDGKIHCV